MERVVLACVLIALLVVRGIEWRGEMDFILLLE
jgi:hypothetical protein